MVQAVVNLVKWMLKVEVNNIEVLGEIYLAIGYSDQIKAVTSCSTHKIDQQETDG